MMIRKKIAFGCMVLGFSGMMMAQQAASTDSLTQALAKELHVEGDTIQAIADSTQLSQPDSVAVALSYLARQKDSTQMVMEQVKALTDKIADESLLNAQLVQEVFSDTAVVNKYNRLLDKMVAEYAQEVESIGIEDSSDINPLYFRLFAPLTLYKSPIAQAMTLHEAAPSTLEDSLRLAAMVSGRDLRLFNELDRVLLSTYLSAPTLVGLTEAELKASQSVSEEAIKKVAENVALNVPTTMTATIEVAQPQVVTDMVVQKPNFWVTKGSFSTQMTESYFSPNWYQGGTNNLNVLSMFTLEANYNNKRKVQWDNKLDARLGFYQSQEADGKMGDIQSNQDLLRLTSKLNLKAIRNWNYTIEAQGNTQMLNHYNGNDKSQGLKSRFLSPADASLTIGMDFKKGFKRGSISIYPGPLSYKMTYVGDLSLGTMYGLEEGKKIRSDLGSKIEVNFDYKITDNISYKTRFYYFTGRYEYVQMDWENTINFQVSKYISTKLFFHTRFDDLVAPNENWKYFQFKQYLMLGLNYAW